MGKNDIMTILAIESSCDETACAIIKDGTTVISNVVASSKTMYEKWGGVVPEVAAREQLSSIIPVIIEALHPLVDHSLHSTHPITKHSIQYIPLIQKNIDAIAVTVGPGLIGSLLVGVESAKTISYLTHVPIIPVNHVLAHIYANFIKNKENISLNNPTIQQSNNPTVTFPTIALVVSGGHTELYLMKSTKDLQWLGGTIDDAAGECFDKTARIIGLGHGGGLAIENKSREFKVQRSKKTITLPRPMMQDMSLNFSFSGLKTAVVREWKKHTQQSHNENSTLQAAFAYEIQESITDVLVKKTLHAAVDHNVVSILISGGVAANTRLREKFISTIQQSQTHIAFFAPPPMYCTDNALSIGSYAYYRGNSVDWRDIEAIPDMNVEIEKR
jgi:N6-L-threonylcarbamoyladenine synthase